jgi:hypothetical protein
MGNRGQRIFWGSPCPSRLAKDNTSSSTCVSMKLPPLSGRRLVMRCTPTVPVKWNAPHGAVDNFYISHGPTQNRPPADVPQGIFHALTQRRRACDIVSNTAPLYTLAEELPRAADLLHGVRIAKTSPCSAKTFVPA